MQVAEHQADEPHVPHRDVDDIVDTEQTGAVHDDVADGEQATHDDVADADDQAEHEQSEPIKGGPNTERDRRSLSASLSADTTPTKPPTDQTDRPENPRGGGIGDRRSQGASGPDDLGLTGSAEQGSTWQRLSRTPPVVLGEAGRAVWDSVAEAPLLLSPAERAMLIMACQSLDLAEECARVVAAEGVVLPWGDSSRAHPLLSKISEHRGLAGRLLRSLADPAEPDSAVPNAQPVRRRRGSQYRQYRAGAER